MQIKFSTTKTSERNYFPKDERSLYARLMREVLVSCKVVKSNLYTEGSRTAKAGTDEQEVHKRLHKTDKQAHHCKVQKVQKFYTVDVTGIGRRKKLLPGDILE